MIVLAYYEREDHKQMYKGEGRSNRSDGHNPTTYREHNPTQKDIYEDR